MIFRAIVGSLMVVILVLVITTVVFWGKGKRAENQFLQATSDLKTEREISQDLRTQVEQAQKNSETLTEQLNLEREALRRYQLNSQEVNASFVQQKESIRILDRENKEFNNWGNTALPGSIIGMLNEGSAKASHSNQD